MKRTGLIIASIGFFLFVQVAQADWTTAKRLTWTSGTSISPAVTTDSSGYLQLVWADDTPGNSEIYYKRSEDNGLTWTSGNPLIVSSGLSAFPAIAADSSGNVHVVWQDNMMGNWEIFYKKSTDGGVTWIKRYRRLTWTDGNSQWPALIADSDGNIHLAWADDTPGNYEIYYKRSTDGGATWTLGLRLTMASGDSAWPALAADSSGNIYVVWADVRPGNFEIFYKKSTDWGATWALGGTRVTWTAGFSLSPSVAVDSSGYAHLVWEDDTPGNFDVYYKRSTDEGTSWISAMPLTSTSGYTNSPAIAANPSGSLHVFMCDDTPGNMEVYYSTSTDAGAVWTIPRRLTWTSATSRDPAVVADSTGNVHLFWADSKPGNFEIYYRAYIQ